MDLESGGPVPNDTRMLLQLWFWSFTVQFPVPFSQTRNKRSGQARSAVSEPTPVKCKSTTTNLSNQHCPIDESFGENSAFDPKCDCTMSAASWSKQLKKPRTGRNRYHHPWDEALSKCGHEIVLQFNTSCGTDVEIWQLGNVFWMSSVQEENLGLCMNVNLWVIVLECTSENILHLLRLCWLRLGTSTELYTIRMFSRRSQFSQAIGWITSFGPEMACNFHLFQLSSTFSRPFSVACQSTPGVQAKHPMISSYFKASACANV